MSLKKTAQFSFRCQRLGAKELLCKVVGRVTVLAMTLEGWSAQRSVTDRPRSLSWLVSETFE
jgi:hypothetical protein